MHSKTTGKTQHRNKHEEEEEEHEVSTPDADVKESNKSEHEDIISNSPREGEPQMTTTKMMKMNWIDVDDSPPREARDQEACRLRQWSASTNAAPTFLQRPGPSSG